ncbi:unnamed protein product [Caenorhabditis auriculariae]|uniref:Uncharacterized protein n=1 Tax=Caenorhabditis auriculariae TaxID=2777116 RepID=A0A8S1H029_9PELO|nr:unnamed protein product [Caenorhabditis auriculariae]
MSLQGREDIYETEDVEPSENQKNDSEPTDTDVELVAVDVDAALKKFGSRILNLKAVDVSDSIAKKRRNFYGNSQYVLEVVGSAYQGNETPEQRMNRLIYEVSELTEQLKSDPSASSETLNDESLNGLLKEIKDLEQKSLDQGDEKKETGNAAERSAAQSSGNAIRLEARLRRLERVLGASSVPTVPLIDTVEDLKLRCETLNPSYVEGLETRINTLLAKLDQVDEKRGSNAETDDLEKKLNEVHEMMSKWDVACSSLPSNTNKVKALSRLHEQAQQFATRLSYLASIREQLEKEIAQSRTNVVELQASTREAVSALMERIVSLEGQLAARK